MPDTIYDELARATGWKIHDVGYWYNGTEYLPDGHPKNGVMKWDHPYATIDDVAAELERQIGSVAMHEFVMATIGKGLDRHDLATLLLRCVQQCGDQGGNDETPAASKGALEKKSHDGRHGVDPDG